MVGIPGQEFFYAYLAHLIAGAKLTDCDYLITLDKKHLLKEDIKNRFKPLKIVNPEDLLSKS